MIVKDYMTPDPLVVSANETVKRIAELIRNRGIRQVPVVDRTNRLVGIVTDRDIRSADADEGGRGAALDAEDIMTSNVISIDPGADLLEAAQILLHHQFGALPVVIGGRVVGMIAQSDLLRRLVELLQDPVRDDQHQYVSPYGF